MSQGLKSVVYRAYNDYWKGRLEGKRFSHVWFNLAYGSNCPAFVTEWINMEKIDKIEAVGKGWELFSSEPHYAIILGKIVHRFNMEKR